MEQVCRVLESPFLLLVVVFVLLDLVLVFVLLLLFSFFSPSSLNTSALLHLTCLVYDYVPGRSLLSNQSNLLTVLHAN